MSGKQQKKLRRISEEMVDGFPTLNEKRVRKICKKAYKDVRKSGNKGAL